MRRDHLDILRAYQRWRTGEDDRTMDEIGFSPSELTRAIDAAIAEIEAARTKQNEWAGGQ